MYPKRELHAKESPVEQEGARTVAAASIDSSKGQSFSLLAADASGLMEETRRKGRPQFRGPTELTSTVSGGLSETDGIAYSFMKPIMEQRDLWHAQFQYTRDSNRIHSELHPLQ